MKAGFFKMFSAGCAALVSLALLPTKASAVDISIGVGGEVFPGVYGNVDITNGYPPRLVYAEPLLIARPSRILEPVYLHVPPGHLKKWDRYCGRYGACSRPVYFVQSRDYYEFSPRFIDQRHVYRDRITYVDRRDYRRDHDHRGHGKHWKHEHREHHGRGKHGRGYDD
jgi:hypothetical protein